MWLMRVAAGRFLFLLLVNRLSEVFVSGKLAARVENWACTELTAEVTLLSCSVAQFSALAAKLYDEFTVTLWDLGFAHVEKLIRTTG